MHVGACVGGLKYQAEVRGFVLPVEQHRLHQGHHITAGIVARAHDGHVDGLHTMGKYTHLEDMSFLVFDQKKT